VIGARVNSRIVINNGAFYNSSIKMIRGQSAERNPGTLKFGQTFRRRWSWLVSASIPLLG